MFFYFDCRSYFGGNDPNSFSVLRETDFYLGNLSPKACSAAAPPKFWATQIFWAVRENLSKASFKRRFHVYVIILKRELFSILTA